MTSARIKLTGTGVLIRFLLRRDRARIPGWVAAIAALVGLMAAGVKGLFPTQTDIDAAAIASKGNAAAIAFNGPAQGLHTLGGQVAFQAGAMGMVIVALMSLLMMGRFTRSEEEAGRLEMLRSLPVGTHAPIAAAWTIVAAMNAVVGVLATLMLLALHLPTAGSIVMGTSYTLIGLMFAGLALLIAQISENTRVVYGVGGAVLGAVFLVRAIGDIGSGTLSWFSPIGWAQKARPYAGEQWWPLLPLAAATVALFAAAGILATRRDLGGGLIAARAGRRVAAPSLGRPVGLAIRLQRGTVIGWSIGILITGAAYGTVAPSIDAFIGRNKALADVLARAGGASLTTSYFATAFHIIALVGAGFAIASTLRLRTEETLLRAEPILATPIPRWRWAASHLTVALAGSVILLGIAGAATGLSYATVGGTRTAVTRLIAAPLVYTPAIWLLVGLTTALIGFAPRAAAIAWAAFAGCLVVGLLGTMLHLPQWAQHASPFERVTQLPVGHLRILPLAALTAVSLALALAGLAGIRRRDIGSSRSY